MSKMNKSLWVVVIVGFFCVNVASGTVLLSEDFEPASGFTAGNSIYPDTINGWSDITGDLPNKDVFAKEISLADFPFTRGTLSAASTNTHQASLGIKSFTEQTSGTVTMSFFFNRENNFQEAADLRAGLFLGTGTGTSAFDANGFIRLEFFNRLAVPGAQIIRVAWEDATSADVIAGNNDVPFAVDATSWYQARAIYDIDANTLQADARKEGDAWTNLGNYNGGVSTPFHPSTLALQTFTGIGNFNRTALDDILVEVASAGVPGDFVGPGGVGGPDGVVDAADIDALRAEIIAGTNNLSFNLNGDGVVDDADFQIEISTHAPTGLGTLLGDADLSRTVTFADFVSLSNSFGLTGKGWADGNFTSGDNDTNFADFVLLSNNFGLSASPSGEALAAAVPEPASLLLLAVGTGFLLKVNTKKTL